MESAQVIVYQQAEAWGIPSVCPKCTALQTLLRFADLNYHVFAEDASPLMTEKQELPVLSVTSENGNLVVSGLDSCAEAIKSVGYDAYGDLTPAQVAESKAFTYLILDRLDMARQYEWYVADNNFNRCISKVRYRQVSFPIRYVLTRLERYEARKGLGVKPWNEEGKVYEIAKECLQVLSSRLGERRKYFYGDSPRFLDALLFGEVVAILYAPVPSGKLRHLTLEYPNILRFVENIRIQYFPKGMDKLEMKNDIPKEMSTPIRTAYEAAFQKTKQVFSSTKDTSPIEEARKARNRTFIITAAASFLVFLLLGTDVEVQVSE
eukprot:jgi/Galph1/4195/GphlegSOOS_G2844.1